MIKLKILDLWRHRARIVETRKRLHSPAAAEWFEYLYNQIKAIYSEQHPEFADKSIMAFRE